MSLHFVYRWPLLFLAAIVAQLIDYALRRYVVPLLRMSPLEKSIRLSMAEKKIALDALSRSPSSFVESSKLQRAIIKLDEELQQVVARREVWRSYATYLPMASRPLVLGLLMTCLFPDFAVWQVTLASTAMSVFMTARENRQLLTKIWAIARLYLSHRDASRSRSSARSE